jgi:hypothetical protein
VNPSDASNIPSSVREVLAYFLRHPHAADTLQDVARWRIQQEVLRHTLDQVSRAITWLVDEGFLVSEEPSPATGPLFRLNASRLSEAEQLIAQLAGETTRVTAPTGDASTRVTPPPAVGVTLTQCVSWIDATLLRYYREHLPNGEDIPGLTRAPATVENLLASPVVPAPASDSASPTAEDASKALQHTLDGGDDRAPIVALYRRLGLSLVELQAVLLSLAPEIEAKYQTVYGVLNDDLGRRTATVGLTCRVLGDALAVRQQLEASGRLLQWRLLESGSTLPHADEALRLDPFLVAWLLGNAASLSSDTRLWAFLRSRPWAGAAWLPSPDAQAVFDRLRELLTQPPPNAWLAVSGDATSTSRAAIEAAADLLDVRLLRIVLPTPAPTDAAEIGEIAARLSRLARLKNAVPVVDVGQHGADALGGDGLAHLFAALTGTGKPLLVAADDIQRVVSALPPANGHSIAFGKPSDATMAAVYVAAAHAAGLQLDSAEATRLATAFPLPLDTIASAVRLARLEGPPGPDEQHFAVFADACRRVASPDLPRFGRRIDPVFHLDDVVLPAEQRAQLDEIVAHVQYEGQVMQTWGFGAYLPYGRGIAALFSGPSGTGKTMAAQAIARALDTEAYLVDLSRVVSKYIGESEKNLDAVFSDAERAGAVLLFDEADALFGKRSEIKDAHDRYANIEVAYLLQRMEAFSGLAILTTNFRQNLDAAFLRRLRFVVEFPRPDERGREALWRRYLTANAPLATDLKFRFLAKRLDLTGGNIQQIALRAAFAAAADHAAVIEMRHVLASALAELEKLGMSSTARDLREFVAAHRAA